MRFEILSVFALVAIPHAAMAASANPAWAKVEAARVGLIECFQTNTVKLGRKNQETADTILMAVRSLCKQQDEALSGAYYGIGALRASDIIAFKRSDRIDAENTAVGALLLARAG